MIGFFEGKRTMFRYFWLASLLFFLLLGCGEREREETLATVNGDTITKGEFETYLDFKRIPEGDEEKKKRLLDQYLEREALAAVIEEEPLLDKDLIQAELNEFRKQMLISRYFEKYLRGKVTDQAIQNHYNIHAEEYEDRKVHAAHILIRTNRTMTEPERKAKLTTAQEAYSKIKAGEDFAEVAKAYSEDKVSSKKGGDLGWMKEGSIDPRFSETLFSLEPGTVSEPFETPFGFHVVKVIEGPQVVKRPFDAVKGDIRYQLRNEAKKAELDRLMSQAEIEKK